MMEIANHDREKRSRLSHFSANFEKVVLVDFFDFGLFAHVKYCKS